MNVFQLTSRLKKCPSEFLRPSNLKEANGVHTPALIADIYRKIVGDYMADFDLPDAATFQTYTAEHLISIQIACWLLAAEEFEGDLMLLEKVDRLLFEKLGELSTFVAPQQWVDDEDRAEEFVRLTLKCCAILPEGETPEEADDRYDALSTIKRQGVLEKSRAAYERMIAIRKKMAEDRAREAANPYGRE